MLVVIVVIAILTIIAVPAFNSIQATQNENTAEAVISAAVGSARDAAAQASGSADAAAVFLYEPGTGTSIVVCQRVGVMRNDLSGVGRNIDREVFVPIEGLEVYQLPAGWSIRGYAAKGSINDVWYERPTGANAGGSSDRYPTDEGCWVFPETAFFDHTKQVDDGMRQTFMVRFEAGTGQRRAPGGEPVIVVSQRASSAERQNISSDVSTDWKRIDRATSVRRWALRVLSDPNLTEEDRRDLIGDRSGDTVLARCVNELAMYPERKLAEALGLRVNPITGTIYFADQQQVERGRAFALRYVEPLNNSQSEQKKVQRWIEGWNLVGNGTDINDRAATPGSTLYVVPTFVGSVRKVNQPNRLTIEEGVRP
ncbi:MAG: type II secretion system protein [Phycisphaerales bacterium]|nr:type II secretion system protein [Phycisphaerales bacterium]